MKKKPYTIQSIENFIPVYQEIPGINVPKINANTSIYGIPTSKSGNAKMYAGSQQLFQAALVTVALDNSVYSNKITNDVSNYKMTVAEAGYYLIIGKISWDTPVADKSYWAYLYKNGSALASTITQAAAAAAMSSVVVDIAYLNAGDYIQLKGYQNSGSNIYSRSGNDNTNLIISKIG